MARKVVRVKAVIDKNLGRSVADVIVKYILLSTKTSTFFSKDPTGLNKAALKGLSSTFFTQSPFFLILFAPHFAI